MAAIVYMSSNNHGGQVLGALEQIRSGIATLQKLDGLRAESIGASQATMAQNFGVLDTPVSGTPNAAASAQTLNDRLANFLTAYASGGNAEYGKLRDLLNAVITL